MKKTISITLANTLFYIEEDAYEVLSRYLNSVSDHFSDYPEGQEIISDIEGRIAERFSETKSKDRIITKQNVTDLINSMGKVEDFDSDLPVSEKSSEGVDPGSTVFEKKLFRDPDDTIIAGVASGLARYFGLDPTFMRLIFILTVLFGGTGILIYIILWLIVPEAKTTTDKLQMRGEKITIESVKEFAREKINEIESHSRAPGVLRRIISLPFIFIGRVFRLIFPIIQKVFGLFLSLVSGFGIFVALLVLVVIIFNVNSPYVDFPLLEIGYTWSVYLLLIFGFLALVIPATFVFLLGIKLLKNKAIFHSSLVISLLGVWFTSLIIIGGVSSKVVPAYQDFMATSPLYQEITEEYALANFNGIEVRNGNRVSLSQGPEFKVSASGIRQSITDLEMVVENDVLIVGTREKFKICIFCGDSTPEILVTMPNLESLVAANGSRLSGEGLTVQSLDLKLTNASRANLELGAERLTLDLENGSRATLVGQVVSANFDLANASRVEASELLANEVNLVAENGSAAYLNVIDSLIAKLENGSYLSYLGNPTVEESTSNGSRVERDTGRQGN